MPTQHTLFPADADAAEPRERRTLTKEEIDKVRHVEGFPIATDEAIIALSDPPHYTACPNPFLADFIAEHGVPYDEATDDYHREPFAADVSEGKNDPIYNAHSYHTKVPHKAIMRYILHYTNPGDIVFDGFCGTGMTGVAAQLCGDRAAVESLGYRVDRDGTIYEGNTPISKLGARKAILSDLSPAATFIAYNYNTPVDVAAFEREARRILAEVEEECGWMYETTHTDGRKGRINYTVWSDVFACPNCGGENVFWKVVLDYEAGTIRDSFPCAYCNAEQTKRSLERIWETYHDQYLGQVVRRAKQVPVLINYSLGTKRFEKSPDTGDLDLIRKIEESMLPYWVPTSRIPDGFNTEQPRTSHGVTHTHHFYTKRNLLVFATLWNKVKKNSLRCALMGGYSVGLKMSRFLAPQWFNKSTGPMKPLTTGTLYIPSLSGEQNWINIFDSRINAVLRQIREMLVLRDTINPYISSSSSTDLQMLPDNSVDYMFTDPPFGANIMYSELNFVNESWLQVFSNNISEAIVNDTQRKALPNYQYLMERCFREFYRILKSGRWMTVEFHNSQNSVWNALQEAILRAGFVVADVRVLDKKQGSFKQYTTVTAVKQDLVISAYKPRAGFEQQFEREKGTAEGAWSFVREHLGNVPVFVESKGKAEVIAERLPYLLFDRMVAFHLQRGASVPLSAAEFYAGLRSRFPERDGMHFLETQAAEYDAKRAAVGDVEQFTFYVSDEKSSIQWLRQLLSDGPLTYQDIQPRFLQELQQNRSELLPELRLLLQANFLLDDRGRWYIPDATKQVDLEKLRKRELLREYATYMQGRGKLKGVRSEAVRAGFEEAYRNQDYAGILAVAARLPEAVLREDSTILTYYDLAQMEMEQ